MLQQDGQEQLAHPKLSVPSANSSVCNPLVSVLLASPNIFTKPKAASKFRCSFNHTQSGHIFNTDDSMLYLPTLSPKPSLNAKKLQQATILVSRTIFMLHSILHSKAHIATNYCEPRMPELLGSVHHDHTSSPLLSDSSNQTDSDAPTTNSPECTDSEDISFQSSSSDLDDNHSDYSDHNTDMEMSPYHCITCTSETETPGSSSLPFPLLSEMWYEHQGRLSLANRSRTMKRFRRESIIRMEY